MSRSGYTSADEGKRFDVVHTVKCLGISYIISVLLLLLLSVLATTMDMDSKTVNGCITGITAVSVIICGFMTAKKMGKGGLINGVIAGVLYTVLLYAIGSIVIGSFNFNIATVTALIMGIVGGGIGGVMGVNTKKRRR